MPVIRALGTTVEVDLGNDIDPAEFAAAWSRCLVHDGEDGEVPRTKRESIARPRPTMTSLTQAITHELISRRRGELLMLHAGAVSHPETGRSVAYAAPGGTGKTTLTRLLGQRYGYLTDETVGVDPQTLQIHPYPKPLSVRTPEGGFPKRERGPDELGLQPAHPAPRLRALILLRRDSSLDQPRWTRLDLFDAILALAPETSSLARLQRPLHLLAELYAALDGFWLAEYAECEQIVDRVAALLGEPC